MRARVDVLGDRVATRELMGGIDGLAAALALARTARATDALAASLLPATAASIGAIALTQTHGLTEVAGVALVIAGGAQRPRPEISG